MPKFFMTVGQKFKREPHPLGPGGNPDGYVEVHDKTEMGACQQVEKLVGDAWSMLYSEEEFTSDEYAFEEMRVIDYFPAGRLGVIEDGKFTPEGLGK